MTSLLSLFSFVLMMNLIDSLRKELKEEKEKSQKLAARNHDLEAQLIQWKENMRTGKLVRKRKRRRVIGKGSCYVYPKGDKYALQARSNGEQMCVKMFNTEAEALKYKVILKKLITEGGSHYGCSVVEVLRAELFA